MGMPGSLGRLTLGSDPANTALAEVYEVPWNNPKASCGRFSENWASMFRWSTTMSRLLSRACCALKVDSNFLVNV